MDDIAESEHRLAHIAVTQHRELLEPSGSPVPKRPRGRPKGSKNKTTGKGKKATAPPSTGGKRRGRPKKEEKEEKASQESSEEEEEEEEEDQ
ncbi:hypothetical protein INR49_017117 [Caranx melampygus]|nr:hypothetical protein INR49_017117 [Caranx melampygus]